MPDRAGGPGAAVAAGWLELPIAGLLEALHPMDGGADTDFEQRTGTTARRARIHRCNNAFSQIGRIGPQHAIPTTQIAAEIESLARFRESRPLRSDS